MLEFLGFGSDEAAPSMVVEAVELLPLMPETEEEMYGEGDFVEEYMKYMDLKVARQNVIFGDAFIPGDFENIVHRTGNKRTDLQDYLSKILRKEKFYRVKTDYLAKGPQRLEKPGSRRKETAGSAGSFTQ